MTSERNDQNAKSSEKAETLGEVVRDLRRSVGETQGTFADRFPVGRTVITDIESHHLPAEKLRPKLIEDFSEARERIEKAVDTYEPRPRRGANADVAEAVTVEALRRNVERLIQRGQIEAATQLLEQHDRDSCQWVGGTDADGYWIANQLYLLYTMRGDSRATDALHSAYFHARLGKGMRIETVECAVRISKRELNSGNLQKAHGSLAETLIDYPDAPQLWLQKGELLWIEQAYSAAYAALTTALTFQADPQEVLRLRVQVLTEWGNVEAALGDIAAFWEYSPDYEVHKCEVLSAHAYLLIPSSSGFLPAGDKRVQDDPERNARDLEKAGELFLEGKWSYAGTRVGIFNYRQAAYYFAIADREAALESYRQALTSHHPLDPVRQTHVREQLAQHERIDQLDRRDKKSGGK